MSAEDTHALIEQVARMDNLMEQLGDQRETLVDKLENRANQVRKKHHVKYARSATQAIYKGFDEKTQSLKFNAVDTYDNTYESSFTLPLSEFSNLS